MNRRTASGWRPSFAQKGLGDDREDLSHPSVRNLDTICRLLLLIVLPGRFRPGLYRNDLILVLIVAGLLRFLLPIGTVLSIIAKGKEEVSADAVRRIQFFTFLLSIPMPLVLLVLWVAYTGV